MSKIVQRANVVSLEDGFIGNLIRFEKTLSEEEQKMLIKPSKYMDASFRELHHQESKYTKLATRYDNDTTFLELIPHLEREKRQVRRCFRRRCSQASYNKKNYLAYHMEINHLPFC